MAETINCQIIQHLALDASLGNVDRESLADILTHLQQCDACSEQFADAQLAWDSLAISLEPDPPSGEFKNRVFARITASSQTDRADSGATLAISQAPPRTGLMWKSGLVAAGIAAGLAALLVARLDSYRQVDLRSHLDEPRLLATAPRIQLTEMYGAISGSLGRGYVIANHATGDCHIYGFDLKPLPPDDVYQLWILLANRRGDNHENEERSENEESEEWIRAATLSLDEDGVGSALCNLRLEGREMIKVVLTVAPRDKLSEQIAPRLDGLQ